MKNELARFKDELKQKTLFIEERVNACLIGDFDNEEYDNREELLKTLKYFRNRVDNIGQEDLVIREINKNVR